MSIRNFPRKNLPIKQLNLHCTLFCVFFAFTCSSCAFTGIKRTKNIEYHKSNGFETQKLNVFAPAKKKSARGVLIFVHGGGWNSGNKTLYSFFGSRMARKGIVTVIPDYPKSPDANYKDMAAAIADAVKWTKNNIANFGGDPDRIFLSGHSAGGHLAALVTMNKAYLANLGVAGVVKGMVLIDAAGLDMYGYLQESQFAEGNTYLKTFTTDTAEWKAGSPIFYIGKQTPPMLILRGEKTYPSIEASNEKFVKTLKTYPSLRYTYTIQKGKKHIPMILQFFNTYNSRYTEIINFINNPVQ